MEEEPNSGSRYTLEFFRSVTGHSQARELANAYFEKTKHLHSSFELLNKANSFFYWFDFAQMKYLYISESVYNVMGYTADEWRAGGPGFAFSTVHPEDVVRLKKCHEELFRYFFAQPLHERKSVRYGYETRVQSKEGKTVWLLQQGSFIEIDQEGKPIISFDVTMDTTDFKKNKAMTLNLKNDATGEKIISYFPIRGAAMFSAREIEIISLLERGLSSKDIADELFISPHTVDTHRRNMIKKAEVRDSVGLVYYARESGLI